MYFAQILKKLSRATKNLAERSPGQPGMTAVPYRTRSKQGVAKHIERKLP